MKAKFKKGDRVMKLDDMIKGYDVVSVFEMEKEHVRYIEFGVPLPFSSKNTRKVIKVTLDDDKVYKEDELTPYSKPLSILAIKVKKLEMKNIPKDSLIGTMSGVDVYTTDGGYSTCNKTPWYKRIFK